MTRFLGVVVLRVDVDEHGALIMARLEANPEDTLPHELSALRLTLEMPDGATLTGDRLVKP